MYALMAVMGVVGAAEPQRVVYASEHVPSGVRVRRRQLYTARMDPAFVPAGTFADERAVAGRVVVEPLLPDAPVREARLAPPDAATGVAALLPAGYDAVRLPLARPATAPGAGDRLDVIRVQDGDACYVTGDVSVLAVEPQGGALVTDYRRSVVATAVHLAVPRIDAGRVASLAPEEAVLAVRNPADLTPLPDVPRCNAPPRPEIAQRDDRVLRRSVDGATIVELLRGENAFVGELSLRPGARIPPDRSPTEEYLWVQQGEGTITIDGIAWPVEPGTLLYLPARAKVSYVNGARTMVAVQVYAGPEPADRYASWPIADPPPPPPGRPQDPDPVADEEAAEAAPTPATEVSPAEPAAPPPPPTPSEITGD